MDALTTRTAIDRSVLGHHSYVWPLPTPLIHVVVGVVPTPPSRVHAAGKFWATGAHRLGKTPPSRPAAWLTWSCYEQTLCLKGVNLLFIIDILLIARNVSL